MSVVLFVGERPTDPLVVNVGQPVGARTPSLLGSGLPAATVAVLDGPAGTVRIDFTEAFASAGLYTAQVLLTGADGKVDYTEPFVLTVKNEAHDSTGAILTLDEVEGITGDSVSTKNVMQAQSYIGLLVDRDLSDATYVARLPARSQQLLRQAVAWQAVSAAAPVSVADSMPQGATAMSSGDQSISFASAVDAQTQLAPLAKLAISRLPWMGMRSIHLNVARAARHSALVSDSHAWAPIR